MAAKRGWKYTFSSSFSFGAHMNLIFLYLNIRYILGVEEDDSHTIDF